MCTNFQEKITSTTIFQQILDIYESCITNNNQQSNCGDHDNLQFSPRIAKKNIRLLLTSSLLVCCDGPNIQFWKSNRVKCDI